jgi:hypothetical protein
MGDPRLIKVGGIFALIVAVMQIVGNALHPPIPTVTADALQVIASTTYWVAVHLIITISYFLFIPFIIGASAAFKDRQSPLVRIGTSFVIVGAALGAAQITTHLTIFKIFADNYVATSDPAAKQNIAFLYEAFWPYSVALEMAHLILIFIAAILFGVAILQEDVFPRWLGWLGIISGGIANVGILVGKLVVHSLVGDIIFAAGLVPLVLWIIGIGIYLLRLQPSPQTTTVQPAPAK